MMRFLILLLVLGAALAYKWPKTRHEAQPAQSAGTSQQDMVAQAVDRMNAQLPKELIPGRMMLRNIVLDGNVAQFNMQALGNTEIKEQRDFDLSWPQLRDFYCRDLRPFVKAGITAEFVAHSAPRFDDIRTHSVQLRANPSACT